MGKIKKLQKTCILTFQALSRPVYSLGTGCLHPDWRLPQPGEARQRQLKRIALVTISQGDAKVEDLETRSVTILPSFLWVRNHAGWICDSLHKHLRGWFLASLSCVLKSGLHHPSKYKRKKIKENLNKPNECFAQPRKRASLLVFIAEESAPIGCVWGRYWPCLPEGAVYRENDYISNGLKTCLEKSRNARLLCLFCVYVANLLGPNCFSKNTPYSLKKPSSFGICILPPLWKFLTLYFMVGWGEEPVSKVFTLQGQGPEFNPQNPH